MRNAPAFIAKVSGRRHTRDPFGAYHGPMRSGKDCTSTDEEL